MTALELYRATLAGQATDHLPCQLITMQFSSRLLGRPFREYVTDYRVMAAAQLQMVEQFGVDCVQTISDPCREVADLGGHPTWFDDEAPTNEEQHALLADKKALASLKQPDPLGGGRMHDRVKAVAKLRDEVGQSMSVQGWVEGPMAMAADLRGIQRVFMDTLDDPEFVTEMFAFAVEMEIAFARAQVEAGADTIGIGDAAASLVSRACYHELVLPFEQQLVDAIHQLGAIVRLHICGNTTHLVGELETLGVEMFDVDYPCDLATARRELPSTALLGNLNPTTALLNGTPDEVYAELAECHRVVGAKFLVGAGCEVPKGTPHDNLRAMVAYAREHAGLPA